MLACPARFPTSTFCYPTLPTNEEQIYIVPSSGVTQVTFKLWGGGMLLQESNFNIDQNTYYTLFIFDVIFYRTIKRIIGGGGGGDELGGNGGFVACSVTVTPGAAYYIGVGNGGSRVMKSPSTTCSSNAVFGAGKGCAGSPTDTRGGGGGGGLSYISTAPLLPTTSTPTFLAVAGG